MRPWTLPEHFSPRTQTPIRALVLLLGAVIALLTIAGAVQHWRLIGRPPVFGLLGLSVGPHLLVRPIDTETRAAGIVTGDRLVALDGHSVWSRDEAHLLAGAASASIVTVVVGRGSALHRVRLRRSPDHLRRVIGVAFERYQAAERGTVMLTALAMIVVIAIAALLGFLKPRVPVAVLLSLGLIGVATTGPADGLGSPALGMAVAWVQVIGFWLFLVAVIEFPDGRVTGRLAAGLRWASIPWLVATLIAQSIHPLQAAVLQLGAALVQRYIRADADRRRQLRWSLAGIGSGMVCVAVAVWLPLLVRHARDVPRTLAWAPLADDLLLAIGAALAAVGLSLSVLRYRLYSVDTVIVRSLIYPVLSLGAVAVFTMVDKLAGLASDELLPAAAPVASASMAAIVSGLLIGPAHRRLSEWATGHFKSDLARARDQLPDRVLDWRELGCRRALSLRLLQRLGDLFHVTDLAWIEGAETTLLPGACHRIPDLKADKSGRNKATVCRADPHYPVRLPVSLTEDGPRTAWLLVGRHDDRTLIGRDERRLLQALALPLSRSLDAMTLRGRRAPSGAVKRG